MNFDFKKTLSLWFGLSQPVGRKEYFLNGLGLMALKYAVDVLLVWLASGVFWNPYDYLTAGFAKPNWYHLLSSPGTSQLVDPLTYLVLFLWMLPGPRGGRSLSPSQTQGNFPRFPLNLFLVFPLIRRKGR